MMDLFVPTAIRVVRRQSELVMSGRLRQSETRKIIQYRIVLIFCGSKFSRIAALKEFVE